VIRFSRFEATERIVGMDSANVHSENRNTSHGNRLLRFARGACLVCAAGQLTACEPRPPATVYVMGPDFHVSLTFSADRREARVNEWIYVRAAATREPWIAIRSSELGGRACWFPHAPAPTDSEAQAKMKLATDDSLHSQYTVLYPYGRRVRFTAPGRYRVWGIWSDCNGKTSTDTITIRVQ
jgi:hypothetical protein